MKIAIVGCGLSGSILARLLPERGNKVDVYEIASSPKAVCGCAMPVDLLQKTASICGLNAERYLLCQGRNIIIKFGTRELTVGVKNLCTFDKQRFMEDLVKGSSATFYFGQVLPRKKCGDYDLVIDASGIRAVLGRLPSDRFAICYQVKADFKPALPYPDFFIDFPQSKEMFRWMFPLSSCEAHVGYGARDGASARSMVLEFIKRFHGRILEEKGRLIRLNPPQLSTPFFLENFVGVGVSVGTISRLGEGIAPSIQSVMLLLENLDNLENYQKGILDRLGWLQNDYYAYGAWCNNERAKMAFHLTKCGKHYDESYGIGFRQLLKSAASIKRVDPLV